MTRRAFQTAVFLGLTALGGCETEPTQSTIQQVFWKTGATTAERLADYAPCEVQALQQVPRAMATAQTPSYSMPPVPSTSYTSCYGSGYANGYSYSGQASCATTGTPSVASPTIGGQLYSYDANQGIRQDVGAQCLAEKGWQRLSFPTCTAEQVKLGVFSARVTALPRAENVLCVTADSGYVLRASTP